MLNGNFNPELSLEALQQVFFTIAYENFAFSKKLSS